MERDDRIPSQTFEGNWIYANNEQNNYKVQRGRHGKWLMFEHKSEIDTTWEKIKTATRQGIFGAKAKVATAKPSPKASNDAFKVICIYTADFDNKIDLVKTWIVELDYETGIPEREIGLDKDGQIIVKLPFKNNYGYWTDNNLLLSDFNEHFETTEISQNSFENYWNLFNHMAEKNVG